MSGPWDRLASWWRLRREDADHVAEVDFHMEQLIARHVERGLSKAEAQRRAILEFGSRVEIRETARDARRGSMLDDAWRDARHACRQLASQPGFTAAVVTTLALAIGAATAVFSVADHVLLRASPYRDAASLVSVWESDRNSGTTREPASLPDWRDMQRRVRSLASVEAAVGAVGTFTQATGEPIRVSAMQVSAGWMPQLGLTPIRGRGFTAAEAAPGGGQVVLISESMWRSHLAARDDVIGMTLRLDDVSTQVIGVMPDEADYGLDQQHARAAYHATYESSGHIDVWLPLQATEAELSRETHPLLLVGRVAPGGTTKAANDEVVAVMAELEAQYPRSNRGRGAFVEPLEEVIVGPSRPLLWALLAAVALLALVATVNVAGLLLVRGAGRAREVALRTALGATTVRLSRQFAVEAGALVGLSVIVGLVVAWGAVRLVRAIGPADVPRLIEAALDWRGVAVAVALAGVIGIVFSLLPALSAVRKDPVATLKGAAGTSTLNPRGLRLRNILVMVQLALCVSLAICATLVLRSFRAAANVDPGFTAQHVVKLQYELPSSRYPRDFSRFPNFTEITQFTERLLQSSRRIPGVDAAAVAAAHPLDEGFTNSWRVVGREAEGADWPEISVRITSPGYDSTMGVRLQSGRAISDADAGTAPPVALINATAARRFFNGIEPLGQQLAFWGIARRIVGVVDDEFIHGVDKVAPPAVYIPLAQSPTSSGVLLVRSERDPDQLLGELRRVVASVDPQLAVYGAEPYVKTVAATLGQRRFATLVMGVFAALTVLLALVGVHGVVAYGAAQRARELGIRLALGARPPAVARLVMRGALQLTIVGVLLGVVAAFAAAGLLAQLLFGISGHDPATFAGVPLGVLAVALLAGLWPTWRVLRSAPLAALRAS